MIYPILQPFLPGYSVDSQRPLKILTVDDDQVVSDLMQAQLSRLGYRVVGHATNGRKAVEGVIEWEPDLVIMDAQMPDPQTGEIDPMAGLDAAVKIQELRPTPVILATAHESTAMIEDASVAGVSAYLVKPVNQGELVRAIAVAMARFGDMQRLRRLNDEIRRINEKLVRSEEQFRTLAEHTPDVLWRYDRELRHVYTSPNVERLVGRPYRSLLGQRFRELGGVSKELAELWEEELSAVFEQGTSRRYEVEFTVLDPAPILEVRLVPERDIQDEVVTVLCVTRDISGIRQAEAALLQSQQQAAVGTMAAGIAHQFNNFNAILLGNIDLLRADQHLDERQQKRLTAMRETVVKETDTIKKLLAVAEELTIDPKPIAVLDLLREAIRREQQHLQDEQIELQFECVETSPIVGDLDQLTQVLQQLISNARHAMLDQPERTLTIGCKEENEVVQLYVSDTGCGIAEEDIERIFLPFFSRKGEHALPDSPLARVRGAGLGLSVAQSIVDCHNGELRASSTAEGSRFTILLPAEGSTLDHPYDMGGAEDEDGSTIDQPTVLIVEDEPMIGELLGEILQTGGYTSFAATDGASALDLLREIPFALIILDLNLPDMNGLEFLQRLRGLVHVYQPKVILSSGNTDSHNLDHMEELGVVSFLSKPYTFEETIKQVREALG